MSRQLEQIAALAMMGLGYSGQVFVISSDEDYRLPFRSTPPRPAARVIFAEPNSATFISTKPKSKRQKRRIRGKAKGARS